MSERSLAALTLSSSTACSPESTSAECGGRMLASWLRECRGWVSVASVLGEVPVPETSGGMRFNMLLMLLLREVIRWYAVSSATEACLRLSRL